MSDSTSRREAHLALGSVENSVSTSVMSFNGSCPYSLKVVRPCCDEEFERIDMMRRVNDAYCTPSPLTLFHKDSAYIQEKVDLVKQLNVSREIIAYDRRDRRHGDDVVQPPW